LQEVVGEHVEVECCEKVPLTSQEDHSHVLEVLQQIHLTVHKMEKALVDEFVLVLDYLDDTLLDSQGDRYLEHLDRGLVRLMHHLVRFLAKVCEDCVHSLSKRVSS